MVRTRGFRLAVAGALLASVVAGPAGVRAADGTADVAAYADADVTTKLGATFSYVFGATNAGPDAATNVVVTLDLPWGLGYYGGPCMSTSEGRTCTYQVGTLPAGGAPYPIQVRAEAVGTYTVTVRASADQGDPVPANNIATTTVTVASLADGTSDLVAGIPAERTIRAGKSIPYEVTLMNLGPDPATGIRATLDLPTGLSLPGGRCSPAADGSTCDVPFPVPSFGWPAGSSATTTVFLHADLDGLYQVRATVSADQRDPDLANNTDTGIVRVEPAADLGVALADDVANTATPGRWITYTATVTNAGPSVATGVTLEFTWDSEVRIVVDQPRSCQRVETHLVCSVNALAASTSATVKISLRPTGVGTISVTATAGSDVHDPVTRDNAATVETRVGL